MSVVSTFAKATFSTAGIRKPHAAQPDLLLLLLAFVVAALWTHRDRRVTMLMVTGRAAEPLVAAASRPTSNGYKSNITV